MADSLFPPARRAEAKARCKTATSGPWVGGDCADDVWVETSPDAPDGGVTALARFPAGDKYHPSLERQKCNAAFAAHARLDLPDALAEIERLSAENARLRAELAALRMG